MQYTFTVFTEMRTYTLIPGHDRDLQPDSGILKRGNKVQADPLQVLVLDGEAHLAFRIQVDERVQYVLAQDVDLVVKSAYVQWQQAVENGQDATGYRATIWSYIRRNMRPNLRVLDSGLSK
jgi:hypothetical protein